MPNWMTNIVDFKGNGAKEATLALYEDGTFAFGFAPIPEEIIGTRSPVRIVTTAEREQEIIDYDKRDEAYKSMMGRSFGITQEMSNDLMKKYGANNWYDWAVNNWGTKWSGCDGDLTKPTQCIFQTAWSTPYKLLQKLSVLYPEVELSVQYADEDFGSNTGTYRIVNGVLVDENVPKYGVESLNMAWSVMSEEDSEPEYQLDYVLEDYENTNASEKEFSDALEDNVYMNWAIDKVVAISYLPEDDYPMFLLEYLRVKAVEVQNFEFAQILKDKVAQVK